MATETKFAIDAVGQQLQIHAPLAEPDPDTIKMFCGQIPREWNEDQLQAFFEEFGPVYNVNVLRDKVGISKGCCFVTFFHRKDAILAQDQLHNRRTLAHHPIQMKPADSENRNDRKLFVGMLGKSMTEDDVRTLFAETIVEECSVLKDNNGASKGCAFVVLPSRSLCHRAIQKLHNSTTFEGCTKPIVVKFADSAKDKVNKNPQMAPRMTPPVLASPEPSPNLMNQLANFQALLQQPAIFSLLGSAFSTLCQQQQQNLNVALQQQFLKQGGGMNDNKMGILLNAPAVSGLQNPLLCAPIQGFNPISHQLSPMGLPKGFDLSPASLQQAQSVLLNPVANSGSSNGQARGPDGCNLFVYHLPQDFTDPDLSSLFSPFGQVLSAKVFIDKQTNLSKCFGFVSFGTALAAQNAIQAMNGFVVGNKKLKVQLKRNDSKPY